MNNIDEVVQTTEQLVYAQTGKCFSDVQRVILREACQESKRTYDQIAAEHSYSTNYVQQVAGPRLWRLLTKVLGQKVSKANAYFILRQEIVPQVNSHVGLPLASSAPPVSPALTTSPVSLDPALLQGSGVDDLTNVSKMELPYESVPLDSPFYIQRSPHEPQCYSAILEPGALLRIKAPRQMGKTSLMMRILAHAEAQGCQRVVVNFQQADQRILGDGDRLLRWMCANMARQLKLPPNLDEFWDEDIGSKMSCTLYMEEYLLEEVDKPIVLALEEVSELFDQAAVAQDIFTMIRTWYGNTKADPLWQQLRMVMVYSTELYVPLNINQSPFNVGLELALKPFDDSHVQELVQRHDLTLSPTQLTQLQHLVAGHPHLIRLALYTLVESKLSFDDFLDTAATDAGVYHDHLHRHLWQLEQYQELGDAFRQVLTSDAPVDLNQVHGFKLYSMGLVNLERNKVSVQCELYQQYFGDRLA